MLGEKDCSILITEYTPEKEMLSILKEPPPSASELVEGIRTNIHAHIQNSPLSDDITMLAVQRLSLKSNNWPHSIANTEFCGKVFEEIAQEE